MRSQRTNDTAEGGARNRRLQFVGFGEMKRGLLEVNATRKPTQFRLIRKEHTLRVKDQRRPADSVNLKGNSNLDSVGDPDERNTAVHPVVLTVEGHGPVDLS